jgi:hypothetical protein
MDLEQNSVSDQTTTGTTPVDWAEAFKSPEFSAGLAEAIAKSLGTRSASDSQVAALERLGDVCPTSMAAVIHATGTHSSNAGMLIAPSFIGISGSTSGPQSSTATQFATTNGTALSDSPPLFYLSFRLNLVRVSIKPLSWGQAVPLSRQSSSRRFWPISSSKCPSLSQKTACPLLPKCRPSLSKVPRSCLRRQPHRARGTK